jgi:hypothetical protein
MASKQSWDNYRSPGIVETDEELLSMVKDVVETIHCLEKMYSKGGAKLVVWGLLQDWHALSGMAQARGLNYEHP